MAKIDLGWVALIIYSSLFLSFLLLPVVVILLSSFGATSYIAFPPRGFSLKWFWAALTQREFIDSLAVSLYVASVASLASSAVGMSVSIAVVRHRFRGSKALQSFLLAPLTVPTVILGLGLLLFFAPIGLLNIYGLILAHVIITIPYSVRTITASMFGVDKILEMASLNLGANSFQTFWKVTLPLVKPGLLAGLMFSFLYSFNNTTISLFLAKPGTITLPVKIFYSLELVESPIIVAISSIVVIITFVFMLTVDRIFGLYKVFAAQK